MNRSTASHALALLIAIACHAQAQVPENRKVTRTLAFEETPAMGWSEHEYRFTAANNEWVRIDSGDPINSSNGTRYLEGVYNAAGLTFEHVDGLEFDLIELDLAEYSTLEIPAPTRFEGIKQDGTVISFEVALDGVIDGDGPGEDFQKVIFPPAWTGLAKVRILNEGWAIDNIQVRGFGVEASHESAGALPVPLEVVGVLEQNASYLRWLLGDFEGQKIVVKRRGNSFSDLSVGLFDPATGLKTTLLPVSSTSGVDPATGERCVVSGNGILKLTTNGQTRDIAWIGQNGVDNISYPAVSNGKVIFADLGYHGQEQYAVFMASTAGVVPILTPETILPDGGRLASYPNAMHFADNTFAIPTSTTHTGSCYLASFDGGPIRVSPGVNQIVPGTSFKIKYREDLLWIDNASIGYLVESGGNETRHHVVTMKADGTSTAETWDASLSLISLPGSGLVQRCYGAAGYDRNSGAMLIRGPLECRDLTPNNLDGIVLRSQDGNHKVLVREDSVVPAFGRLESIGQSVAVANGEFFFTAINEEKTIAVLRGRLPLSMPTLKAGTFLPTADGSVRFMVENLTHGTRYRVESSPDLAGPWATRSSFTGGSPARSVFGAFEMTNREFFRVIEE